MIFRDAISPDAQAIAMIHTEVWAEAYRGEIPDTYLDSIKLSKKAVQSWADKIEDPKNDGGAIFFL